MSHEMVMHQTKVYGKTVSLYAMKKGYLDYRTLAELVGDMILNNSVRPGTEPEDWELISGEDCAGVDADGNECDPYSDECDEIYYYDVYQDYLISERGYRFLRDHTDELVYYNSELDLYIWGVTHFGTSWDYVLTNIKLVDG